MSVPSPDNFPDSFIARASSRIHDEVGDGHRGGESLVRWDLVDRVQVRIPLGRRDVAMAHDLLSNGLGYSRSPAGTRLYAQGRETNECDGIPTRWRESESAS